MIKDDLIKFLELRLKELKEAKEKIGVTYSRSSEIALEWIDGLINVNQRCLDKLK